LEETLVVTVTVPETVAPGEGAVIETVGGVDPEPDPFFFSARVSPTQPAQKVDTIIINK